MSSPHKITYKTPSKKTIRSQLIKQENSKRKSDEKCFKNSDLRSRSKPKINIPCENDNKWSTLIGRSLTPQPQKSKITNNYYNEEKPMANSNISKRSLTPNARQNKNMANSNISIRSLTPNARIIKIDAGEDQYSHKSYRSKILESKKNHNQNINEVCTPTREIIQEHDNAIMEREKNKLRNNYIRNMYYIEHKYKNCPCYKCICGKCFCPMKMLRSNSPFMNSVYQQNFIPKAAINEECPFKKLQEFQYKPKNSDIEKMMSTYKDCFKEHPVQTQKHLEKKEYEKNNIPLFSSTNYNQNFKDWTKLKGLDKPEKMNPLNNLHSNACPIMNKTSYNDCFGAKSNDPLDKELEDLLKSKRDKNQKNPLSSNFRSPFETENQAKFKPYAISQIPERVTKKDRISQELYELPKPKYETDYSRNFRAYRLKPFICPARVELDKLSQLESRSFLK